MSLLVDVKVFLVFQRINNGCLILINFLSKTFSSGNFYQNQCIHNGILNKGNILQSESAKCQLKLQHNEKLEIICEGSVIWSPLKYWDTDSVTRLYFKNESSLGVFLEDKSPVWTLDIGVSDKYFQKLVLENDGRLVLYDNKSENIWESHSAGKCRKGKQISVTVSQKVNILFNLMNVHFLCESCGFRLPIVENQKVTLLMMSPSLAKHQTCNFSLSCSPHNQWKICGLVTIAASWNFVPR